MTDDYFPEIYKTDVSIFPSMNELKTYFGEIKSHVLAVPEKCIDGFLAAYWKRPEAYLDEKVRSRISTFFHVSDVRAGLSRLSDDLTSGRWQRKNAQLSDKKTLDTGYRIVVAEF